MRVPHYRQLREALFTGLFALTAIISAQVATAHSTEEFAGELQAARLLENTLRKKGASQEDRRKLDELYSNLATRFPSEVSAKNAHAAFLWDCDEHDRAEKIWKEAEKLAPENGETQHGLSNAALRNGDVRTAAAHMAKACAGQPENASYHFDFANILFLFRRELVDPPRSSEESIIDQAMKHYAEACRLAPLNIDYARGHAETFYSLPTPNWEAALSAWNHLFQISPQKDFALANLATVHLKLGRKDQARACVEQIQSPEFASRKARLLERIERE